MTVSYVDFTFYTGTYKGTVIAIADFPRLSLRASAIVDNLTFARAADIVTVGTDLSSIDSIKMATCAVAEELQTFSVNGGAGAAIASERVGNYSVSYVNGSSTTLSDGAKLSNAAKLYLGMTGLMYKGLNEYTA